MAEEIGPDGLVVGRTCGPCTMCCKVLKIDWLEPPKAAGQWCGYCKPGQGCKIWENRPDGCAAYHCHWRRDPRLGDEWRPDKAGFLINLEAAHLPYSVSVDPGRSDSWRKEPYYSGLKRAALSAIAHQKILVVIVGQRHWLVLPDGDVQVPAGLENTDFRVFQETPLLGGRWKIQFLQSGQVLP